MTAPLRLVDASPAQLGGVAGWVVDLMETLGVGGAGLAVALENIFPPLPSEIVLPLAGFTASQGTFSVVAVILVTTLGSLVGALALYWLGRRVGQQRLSAWADRIPLMHARDIDRTVAWFARHGGKAVFFGRMIPVFRSLISIPAGVERMNVVKFSLLTTAGSLIWNTAFVLAGYLLGQNWALVEQYAGFLQYAVTAVVVVALTVFVVHRLRRRRGRQAPRQGNGPDRGNGQVDGPSRGRLRQGRDQGAQHPDAGKIADRAG